MRPILRARVAKALLFGVGLWGLGACSGGGREPRQDEAATVEQRRQTGVRPSAARPLVDVPAILHLSPAEFSVRLGPPAPLPSGFADPGKFSVQSTPSTDSLALFQIRGLSMVVAFDRATGAVQDVLLLGADEPTLMRQATLLPDAPGYLLLPVFKARHADQLMGLRVVPK